MTTVLLSSLGALHKEERTRLYSLHREDSTMGFSPALQFGIKEPRVATKIFTLTPLSHLRWAVETWSVWSVCTICLHCLDVVCTVGTPHLYLPSVSVRADAGAGAEAAGGRTESRERGDPGNRGDGGRIDECRVSDHWPFPPLPVDSCGHSHHTDELLSGTRKTSSHG